LKAYRTEWIVFDEDVKISGSIDMVFENPDGTCQIYDWKRIKEISYQDSWSNKMAKTESIKHLPDTNFWHYSLQLNTYREILERKYNKVITDMYLVCMHPENPLKNYERIQVHDLRTEVRQLFKEREQQILQQSIPK
jgi:ATP-dependent exoDNAse (exonuclease V) beta subunit